MSSIGDRIKKRRIEIGLSVDQVAEKIGKNRATVYRYESSEIEKFPIDILTPLADALRTTPAFLMGWEDTPEDSKLPPESGSKPDDGNLIQIAARNGTYIERRLTDQQLAALTAILDQMPDATDDL